jgi:hypothetical protein
MILQADKDSRQWAMRTDSSGRDISEPTEIERCAHAKAEAEQVITEIGIILAVMLGLAVLAHLLVTAGGFD